MNLRGAAGALLVSVGLSVTAAPGKALAQESAASQAVAWIDTLTFDAGIAEEIALFAAAKESGVDEGYEDRLAAAIRRLIATDVERQVKRVVEGVREGFIEVTVLDAGFASPGGELSANSTERACESSFVRTEVTAFFAACDTEPEEALRIYTDPEFRKKVSPRIVRIWQDDEFNCVEMGGVKLLVDPMKFCDRVDDLHAEDLAVEHSQTVKNDGGKGYQPVFFKESVKSFIRCPDGLAFCYINYSRTVGLGAVEKKIARGKIEESETRAVEELGRRLHFRADRPAK